MGGLLTSLGNYLLSLIQWFVGAVWNTLITFLDVLMGLLPQSWQQEGDSIVQYVEYGNAWVPIDYGVTLFGVYYTFMGALLAYRLVKSWIPTVSG